MKQRHEHLRFAWGVSMYGVHVCKHCDAYYCTSPGSKNDFCNPKRIKENKKKTMQESSILNKIFFKAFDLYLLAKREEVIYGDGYIEFGERSIRILNPKNVQLSINKKGKVIHLYEQSPKKVYGKSILKEVKMEKKVKKKKIKKFQKEIANERKNKRPDNYQS